MPSHWRARPRSTWGRWLRGGRVPAGGLGPAKQSRQGMARFSLRGLSGRTPPSAVLLNPNTKGAHTPHIPSTTASMAPHTPLLLPPPPTHTHTPTHPPTLPIHRSASASAPAPRPAADSGGSCCGHRCHAGAARHGPEQPGVHGGLDCAKRERSAARRTCRARQPRRQPQHHLPRRMHGEEASSARGFLPARGAPAVLRRAPTACPPLPPLLSFPIATCSSTTSCRTAPPTSSRVGVGVGFLLGSYWVSTKACPFMEKLFSIVNEGRVCCLLHPPAAHAANRPCLSRCFVQRCKPSFSIPPVLGSPAAAAVARQRVPRLAAAPECGFDRHPAPAE